MKGAAKSGLLATFVAIAPVPAARPKVSRWGTYYPKTYETYRKNLQGQLARGAGFDRPAGDIGLVLEFVCAKPRTGKLTHPRGDVDNYVKGAMDAMTSSERFWKDDTQVGWLAASKRYATPGEEPGVHILIGGLE